MTQQWSATRKNAADVLSNANLTVTQNGSDGVYCPTVATESFTSGKYYWELHCDTMGGPDSNDMLAGIANASYTTGDNNYPGVDTNSFGWFHTIPYDGTGGTITNGTGTSGNIAGFKTGSRLDFALDITNRLFWGRVDGGAWNVGATGTQDPASGQGGIAIPAGVFTGGISPVASTFGTSDAWTAHFAQSDWVGTAPTGFGPFDSSAIQKTTTGTATGTSTASASGTKAISATGTAAGSSTAAASSLRAVTATAIGTSKVFGTPVTYLASTRNAIAAGPIASQNYALDIVSQGAGTASGTANVIGDGSTGIVATASAVAGFDSTNECSNPRFVGAVAGTVGIDAVLPTNTGIAHNNGLSAQIIGTGIESGLDYIDVRWFGTPNANGNFARFQPMVTGGVAANPGDNWTQSIYIKWVAGDFTNIGVLFLEVAESDANRTFIGNHAVNITPNAVDSLGNQRFTNTLLGLKTGTAFVACDLGFSYTAGDAIDITLRFAGPQLEIGDSATDLILPPIGTVETETRATTASGTAAIAAEAVASGSSTVAGVGASLMSAVGTAVGTSTANGAGPNAELSAATATGTSTALAHGEADVITVASAIGSSTASASTLTTATGTAHAIGACTVLGLSISKINAVGTATGTSTASSIAFMQISGVGTAVGSSTADADGTHLAGDLTVGTAEGHSHVHGVSAMFVKRPPVICWIGRL